MFTHVVMMKVKEAKDIQTVADILLSMEGKIPQINELEVGINEIESDRNFDVILITRFDSKDEMDVYQVSDYHQHQVLDRIRPLLEKTVAADYTAWNTGLEPEV